MKKRKKKNKNVNQTEEFRNEQKKNQTSIKTTTIIKIIK